MDTYQTKVDSLVIGEKLALNLKIPDRNMQRLFHIPARDNIFGILTKF